MWVCQDGASFLTGPPVPLPPPRHIRPPPLPPPPPAPIHGRVRAIAAPFLARQQWLVAFLALAALYILDDVYHLSWWGLGFDVFVVAAMGSLWRALAQFRLAAHTGDLTALARAMTDLQRYIKVTVVVGFASLAVMLVLIVVVVAMLRSGSLTPAMLGAWRG